MPQFAETKAQPKASPKKMGAQLSPPPPPPTIAAPSTPPKVHLRPFFSAKLLLLLLLLSLTLVILPLSISLTMPSLLFPTSSSPSNAFFLPRSSRPFFLTSSDAAAFPVLSFLRRTSFNQTLLDMAAVDLGEAEERRQIDKILDGSLLRSRYADRFDHHHDHLEDYHLRRHTSSSSPSSSSSRTTRYPHGRERLQRLPLQLSSPRYEPHWGSFKRLLQNWVSKKRHEPKVMTELLRLVKEPIDRHYMKQQLQQEQSGNNISGMAMAEQQNLHQIGKPYGSCAVVGNSGILLNQSYGAQIDSHDMVMRLNNARIKGFEEHVGTKTTISFVNSNILHMCERRNNCFCHPYGSEVPLVMYICQVVHFMDIAFCNTKLQAPIVVTDARFDTLCARIVKYYSLKLFSEGGRGGIAATPRRLSQWSDAHDGTFFHYSSGMQAVLLAVGMCDKVSLFGFGKSPSARHHYHSLQKEELRLHDYVAEYQFYKDLATGDPRLVPFLDEAGISIPPLQIYW